MSFCRDFPTDFTFFADVGEVGGESVAGVDHRAGKTFLAQDASEFEARFGIEVTRVGAGSGFFSPT